MADYRPEYARQAERLYKLGATVTEVADFFQVTLGELRGWMNAHDDFAAACKLGKDFADDRVEQSLYKRANGYEYDAVKIIKNKGEDVVIVPYKEHVPPDTTACIYWTSNRRPVDWKRNRDEAVSNQTSLLTLVVERYGGTTINQAPQAGGPAAAVGPGDPVPGPDGAPGVAGPDPVREGALPGRAGRVATGRARCVQRKPENGAKGL